VLFHVTGRWVKGSAEELGRRLTLARKDLSEPPQDKKPARRRFGDGWSIYPPSPIGAPTGRLDLHFNLTHAQLKALENMRQEPGKYLYLRLEPVIA